MAGFCLFIYLILDGSLGLQEVVVSFYAFMAYCVSSVGLITVWIFKIVIAGGVISFLAVVAVGLIISLCLAIGYILQPQDKRGK